MNFAKIIFFISILVLATVFVFSTRYEIQVLGKSRDACLRLDKWTGKIELNPIDVIVYQKWIETQRPQTNKTQ